MLATIIGFVSTALKYPVITEIQHEFITEISLFIGYFIIRDWFFLNDEETLIRFLFSIVIVNTIASVFFIIHEGLHYQIYLLEDESIAEIINGQGITRDLWIAPLFTSFSIIFLMIFRKKWPFYSEVLLAINILAIFVTYTRSLLMSCIFFFLIYFILNGIKQKRLDIIAKNILIFSVIGLIAFFSVSKFLPNETTYFKERFAELPEQRSTGEEDNLTFRFNNTSSIISRMDQESKMFGMGPVTEKELPLVSEEYLATSDMVWTGVIFRWGFVGLVLFIIIYLYAGLISFKKYFQTKGPISDLFLFILIFICSQVIESFFSWTFLSRHGFATGLWYFAMLSVLIEKNKQLSQLEITENLVNSNSNNESGFRNIIREKLNKIQDGRYIKV
jgi:O-antigen ligase